MTVLSQIAYFQNRRDEVPNQQLAQALAAQQHVAGIQEIAQNLGHENPAVQSDCLKVLYEIGYLNPLLIADYVEDFLRLTHSHNNRLVWGSMIALATIAPFKGEEIAAQFDYLVQLMAQGSVITRDNGMKALGGAAASHPQRNTLIFPFLLQQLATCRPKEVAQYAESVVVAVTPQNKADFVAVVQKRLPDLTPAQSTRVRKVLKTAEKQGL
ncbi:MAG: hypothetical protein KA314_15735 [Chloroflexi bacterium]|nr:hypothetical protein [Chloroflexota bacterium]MBP8057286.1 hypothetical protein [Chloroflexota bacterium]